ncbi:hypothetical protein GCM10020220_113350 [Nonomuraea rubra]|uniref:cation:proton antiporter domain-containing protein n=1 Tax=Nonomuraea rubra TaxID=46180 RepID=UPI0031ED4684
MGLLSVGLVLFTTAVVGLVVHLMLPDLPLALAFALGANHRPARRGGGRRGRPPAGAAAPVADHPHRREPVQRRHRAHPLRVAIGAAVGGAVSLWEGLGEFLFAAAGGVAIGLALAFVFAWIFRHTRDSLVENTLMLLIPFGAYLAAESVHASGVIAVVIVGLYLGHRMHLQGFGTRLVSDSVWKVTDFFLEAIVFALIGLQLVTVIEGITGYSPWAVAGYAAAVLVVTIVSRFVWVFAVTTWSRCGARVPGPRPRSR